MSSVKKYFEEVIQIAKLIDVKKIELLAKEINLIRKKNGRLFFLGVGGSAANCSHAVNDFRKICEIECYTPIDNVSELTARINDDGWNSIFASWLNISKANKNDAIFIFSVGGGDVKKNVSVNLVESIKYAKKNKMKIFGIVGRKGGYTKKHGDNVIVIPDLFKKRLTPHSEAFQAVIWHCLVSHPLLQKKSTKW